MQPLKITATIRGGRVSTNDAQLPIDSMLAWAWMMEHHPEWLEIDPGHIPADEWIEPELPLERRGEGDRWYWAASFAQAELLHEYIKHWHKRFDADLAAEYADFGKRKPVITPTMNKFRPWRMPFTVMLLPEITWYAVGDLAQVERLLHHVTAIGKNRAQGFGEVDKWTVEPWPHDWSERGPDGRLMRALPSDDGIMMAGIRPPYWKVEQHVLCEVP